MRQNTTLLIKSHCLSNKYAFKKSPWNFIARGWSFPAPIPESGQRLAMGRCLFCICTVLPPRCRRRSQVVRQRFAKPPFVGSIPTAASKPSTPLAFSEHPV